MYYDRFPLAEIQLPVVKEGDLNNVPKAGVKWRERKVTTPPF